MPEPLPTNDALKKEFVCDSSCVPIKNYKYKLGNSFATALTGFVGGAIVATIMLYPWIKFLGDYCPGTPQSNVTVGTTRTWEEPATPPAAPPEAPSGTMPAAGEPGAAPPPPPGANLQVQTGPAQ